MVSSAQFVSPKPALLPPGGLPGQPGLPGSGSAGGPSFSQFLNDQPEMLTPPAHTDPVPTAPDSAPPAANTAAANAAARRKEAAGAQSKAGGAAAPRPAEGTAGKPADAAAAPTTATSDTAGTVADTAEAAAGQEVAQDDTEQASSLTEFAQLIGLALPNQTAAAPSPAADPTATSAVPTAEAAAGASAASGGRVLRTQRGTPGGDEGAPDAGTRPMAGDDTSTKDRRLTDTAVRPTDSPRAKAIELGNDKTTTPSRSPSTDTLQATSARVTAEAAAPRSIGATEGAAPNFAAMLAQSLPPTVAGGDAAPAPAAGQVHAALHSPGFAPELAANVSLLAADGVQHAELQLNPADMGPVAVQIIVDGAQAQVSFHALHAETRQALEQSLPDLAAALQGQGLTLSGGGVFQQSPRDAQGGNADARSADDRGSSRTAGAGGVGGANAAGGTPATASVRRAAGLLDTFA